MKAWIPLSLTLLLGQTPTTRLDPPPSADERPFVEPGPGPTTQPGADTALGTGGAGTPGARVGPEPGEQPTEPFEEQPLEETEEELSAAQELRRVRAQLEALRAQLEAQRAEELARQQEERERLQALEAQQALQAERARELERLQQLRLVSLEQAYGWLVSADQQLELGELDVGPALTSAQRALATALSTAAETGRGQTVRLIERARDRIAVAREAVEERDLYPARLELQAAGYELREAWRLTLNRPSATFVSP